MGGLLADIIPGPVVWYTAAYSCGAISQSSPAPPKTISGTGFYVSLNAHILTNDHVVTACHSTSVAEPGRATSVARIIARDPVNDLALLLVPNAPRAVPPFKSTVRIGEAVAVYGFPLAGVLPSSGNFTMGHVTATEGLKDDKRMLQISAPVQPGNSGGPLMDATGSIVGVVTLRLNPSLAQNANFAIKSSVAMTFLERNGVTPPAAPQNAAPLSSADLAERAQQFTVFVTCHRH
jgi:serine protease Do